MTIELLFLITAEIPMLLTVILLAILLWQNLHS